MFKKSKEKGTAGETKVINYLISINIEIKDFTLYEEHKEKQKKGYDIELKNEKTGEWDRVDIKTNIKNGFLYLEDLNDHKTELGWFWTSSADFIYHYDLKQDKIYGYNLKKMRNFIYINNIEPKYGRHKNLIGLKIEENKLIQKI